MRGATLNAVQQQLGHTTIQMTMRYAHLAPQGPRDALSLLDRPVYAAAGPRVIPAGSAVAASTGL